MMKRLLRGAIRRTQRWLKEEPDEKIATIEEKRRYRWLNGQCLKIWAQVKRRPNYVWGVIHGAGLAQALGAHQISVVELGVAGGNGLIALQDIAARVEEMLGVKIDVYGFDTGTGLPKPTDYRDLPNFFSEGFYPIDVEKLRTQLNKANLRLGQIQNTMFGLHQFETGTGCFYFLRSGSLYLHEARICSFRIRSELPFAADSLLLR